MPGAILKFPQADKRIKMFGKVGSFFNESKQELAKANWPTRHELMGSTLLVIVVTLIMAALIFAIDFALSILIRVVTIA